jgi:hypothetical protein
MWKTDIASDMQKALTSNQDMFSKAATLEKLAFEQPTIKTVSDQDQKTEIELDLEQSTSQTKEAASMVEAKGADCAECGGTYVKDKGKGQPCACKCGGIAKCAVNAKKGLCSCHSDPPKPWADLPGMHSAKATSNVIETLLKVSEDLDNLGFDKLAAVAIVIASKVSEAKAKKKSTKKDSKKSTEKSKKSDKKMTEKEKAQAAKKKDSKKSTEKK